MRQRCAGNGTRIWDWFPQGLAAVVLFCCLSIFPHSVSASTLSFSGVLTQDDEVVFIPFIVTAESDATFRTLSYSGGTDASGSPASPGGFDPVLSLFDQSGNLLIFVDDGSEPEINADPATGLALDSFFVWSLASGDYTLGLSQSNNYPGLTLSDPFSRAGEGNFTEAYGCGAGQFFDFGCNGRGAQYIVEVLNITGSAVVTAPVPGGLWLFSSGVVFLMSLQEKSRRVAMGLRRG